MNPIRSTVSVIICAYTFERWDDLLAGIHSLFGQTRLPSEVIVVIDHNPELLERVRSNIPNIILIENTGPVGVSSARNAGVAAAKGELIAFLDDDAVAHPDWLAKLCYWFDQPSVLGAGSKINPVWTKSRPRWFPDEFGWVLGYSHKGLPEKVENVRNFFGAGMCIRREVFEKVGNFRSELGRVHQLPVGCEETELCIRVLQRIPEGKLIYAPDSIVNHRISPSRINWHYFQHRCYSEGLSKAIMSRFVGMSDGLSSERAYTFRILPRGIANGVADAFLRGDWSGLGRAFAILMGFTFTVAGYIAESLKYEIERLKNHEDRLQNLYD